MLVYIQVQNEGMLVLLLDNMSNPSAQPQERSLFLSMSVEAESICDGKKKVSLAFLCSPPFPLCLRWPLVIDKGRGVQWVVGFILQLGLSHYRSSLSHVKISSFPFMHSSREMTMSSSCLLSCMAEKFWSTGAADMSFNGRSSSSTTARQHRPFRPTPASLFLPI